MKRSPLGVFLIFLFCLCGCAKVQVSADFAPSYDFSGKTGINWSRKSMLRKQGMLAEDQLLADRFVRAITATLTEKGFEFSDSPQLLIDFSYDIEPRLVQEPINTGIAFGYGRYGRFGGVGINTGTGLRQYDQGRLFISIYDATTDKQVWRGLGTREVFTHMSPERIDGAVAEMVFETLKQFPPK